MRLLLAAVTALGFWAATLLARDWYLPKSLSVAILTGATAWSVLVIVRRAPGRPGGLLAAFCLALNLFMVGHLAGGLPPGNLWAWLSWTGGVVAAPLLLDLVSRFPLEWPDLRRWIPVVYALVAVVALAEVVGWSGLAITPGLEFVATAYLLALLPLRRAARMAENRLVQRQASLMMLGILLAAVPFIAFLPGLLPPGVGQFMSLAVVFLAVLPVGTAVAMARPNLYDPSALVRNAIVWTGVLATALLAYLALVHPLAWLSGLLRVVQAREAGVFVAAFTVALLIRPLQLGAESLVDRLLFPERLGFRAFLEEISQALATTIRPDDLEHLAAVTIPNRLKAAGGLLLAVDAAGQNLAPLAASAPLVPPGHPLRSLAEQTHGPAAFRGRAVAEYLGIQVPALLLPLRVGDRLAGLYFLGTRQEGDMYADDEVRQLTVLSHHLAVAVENVRGYRQVEALSRRALAEVEERNHIAREIHDTLAQGLTGIALQFEIAQMFRESRPEKAEQAIARGLELARANLAYARRSVLELRASALGADSLPEALARAVAHTARDAGAEDRFRLEGAYTALPARVETALYRITQEALHNALKYAEPARLEVVLAIARDRVRLTVTDDGKGFDPATLPATGNAEGGFGLTGMGERARLLGGSLHVESNPGLGTRIEVEVPLREEDEV